MTTFSMRLLLRKSYTRFCPSVRGDNPRALLCGFRFLSNFIPLTEQIFDQIEHIVDTREYFFILPFTLFYLFS